MSPTLLLTLGAPGCGKSTAARLWQLTGPRGPHARPRVRISRDELRAVLHGADSAQLGADGDPDAERRVTIAQRAAVTGLLVDGADVIIDDTNIRPGVLARWIELAGQVDARPIVWDFRAVPVETCLSRIAERVAAGGRHVPESVVRRLHAEALRLVVPGDVTVTRHGAHAVARHAEAGPPHSTPDPRQPERNRTMYIADYEIPCLESDFYGDGDRAAGERLLRFYETEMASMAIRRARIVERLAEMDRAPIYVEAEVVDEDTYEA